MHSPATCGRRSSPARRNDPDVAAGKPKRPGEFALIERYFRPLAIDPGAFGLIDDAALYAPTAITGPA